MHICIHIPWYAYLYLYAVVYRISASRVLLEACKSMVSYGCVCAALFARSAWCRYPYDEKAIKYVYPSSLPLRAPSADRRRCGACRTRSIKRAQDRARRSTPAGPTHTCTWYVRSGTPRHVMCGLYTLCPQHAPHLRRSADSARKGKDEG